MTKKYQTISDACNVFSDGEDWWPIKGQTKSLMTQNCHTYQWFHGTLMTAASIGIKMTMVQLKTTPIFLWKPVIIMDHPEDFTWVTIDGNLADMDSIDARPREDSMIKKNRLLVYSTFCNMYNLPYISRYYCDSTHNIGRFSLYMVCLSYQ